MVVPSLGTLPRVPDNHGDIVDEKIFSDLYIRTTWVDANLALDQIKKGKAHGRRSAIYVRSIIQKQFQRIGISIQKHAGKILFIAILILSTFCVGLKSVIIHSKVHQLWIHESGRLADELKYTYNVLKETDSATHQLLIQIPKDTYGSVLNKEALLTHLQVLQKASAVTVKMNGIEWSLRDMCNVPTVPQFDTHYLEQIFENVIPCSIITPLDCFWEGSKLLGPVHPVHIPWLVGGVSWRSLNPLGLLHQMKTKEYQFNFDTLEKYMKVAGITTGYSEKPCLNQNDKQCPLSARNKNSTFALDIGAELTGGCYSYAVEYMHWPEELIVGGVERNRTNYLKKAKALQTVIQMMTAREMYDSFNGHYKVHQLTWNTETATEVLNAWQEKFSNEVNKIMKSGNITTPYDLFAFSSASLDEILGNYSHPNMFSLGIEIIALLIYATLRSIQWKKAVKGQCSINIAGVILITVSTTAGLGLCAIIGIAFNAATTQVIPYIALALGTHHVFLFTNTYAESTGFEESVSNIHFCSSNSNNHITAILRKAGPTVITVTLPFMVSLMLASFILIPALKVFCLQTFIVVSLNLTAVLIVFPALISMDIRRRLSGRADIFCCWFPPWKRNRQRHRSESTTFPLSVTNRYVKLSGYKSLKFKDGLDLLDLVPKDTDEYKFLFAQGNLFGFYNMFAVTQGDFDYPNNQKLLHDYHDAFVRVSYIMKNDDGGVPSFWLAMFRDWLLNLQSAFDKDYADRKITQEHWFVNASADAVLAYKLLVQTGHVDNPIDKTLVQQNRLVDINGIINPKAFYNYLSAWASNDVFSYGASQGKLRPEPWEWYHSASDFELKIPKSLPLIYTQLPFYLHRLTDTNAITSLIIAVRAICDKFEERGLPNYPSGIPFIFWDQYINLRGRLFIILVASLLILYLISLCYLLSLIAATLVCINSIIMIVQLTCVMTILGIKLSAISAVILTLSIGLSLTFTAHLTLGFVTSIGNNNRRILLALQFAFPSMVQSTIVTLISLLMLCTSPFEFIVRHFFLTLLSFLIIGSINGLLFFPIILSLVPASAELIPFEYLYRISTPSPPVYRHNNRRQYKTHKNNINKSIAGSCKSFTQNVICNKPHHHHHHHHHHQKSQINSEPSLTTISEEPQSWKSSSSSIDTPLLQRKQQKCHQLNSALPPTSSSSSSSSSIPTPRPPLSSLQSLPIQTELQSIVVKPEVTVETSHNGNQQNTKVTATANIKVELIASTNGRATTTTSTTTSTGNCHHNINNNNNNNNSR